MAYDGELRFGTGMDTSGFQKDANKLGELVKGLAVFDILKKGFQTVVNSIDSAVDRFDTLNKFPVVLEQMGYSAEASAAASKKLADGIQGLPTTLNGIVSKAQRLTVLTGNLEGAVDTTLALNNAFLASGSSATDAERGLNQYVQMLSSGKVDMQSWRTLQETMGYALNETAKAFGFAGESAQNDLYAALRDGDITFSEFNAKIIELNGSVGGFADLAQTSSGGIRTAWTNLQTAIVRNVTDIIASIDDMLSNFGGIEGVINGVKNVVDTVFTFIGGSMKALIPIIATVVTSLGVFSAAMDMTQVVKSATEGFSKFMGVLAAHPIMAVIAAVAGLAVGIGLLITSINNGESGTEKLIKKLSTLREEIAKTDEMDAQIQRYETLKKELENTSLSSEEAASKTQELNEVRQWIIDNSNGIVTSEDNISGAFDRQLEHLKGNVEEQKALNGARLEAAMQEVQLNWAGLLSEQNDLLAEGTQLQSQYNQTYDERNAINKIGIDALTELAAAQKDVEDAEARRKALLDELNTASGTQYQSTGDISDALERYDTLIEEAAGNEERVAQLQSERAFVAEYLARITDDETAATQRLTEAEQGASDALEQASAVTETYVFNHLTGMIDTVSQIDGELVTMEGSLNDNAAAQLKNAEAIAQSEAIIRDYVNAGLMTAEDALEKYGIAIDETTDATEDLSGSTEEFGDTQQDTMSASSADVKAYAQQFGMFVEDVVKGIADMGGDQEKWATEQERILRAAQVAEDDYIQEIKAGNTQIAESYAIILEKRRKNGDELTNVERAQLEQFQSNKQQEEALLNQYAETYRMTVEEVKAGIEEMGGDQEAFVTEQEQRIRALEVAEQDHIQEIKAGNIEITESDGEKLEELRRNGEDLSNIQQAELEQHRSNKQQQEALIEGYAETYGVSADQIIEESQRMSGGLDEWATKAEQEHQRALVAEQDYIAQIKAGNIEIDASYAQSLEARRVNGEELNAVDQAYLDQWKSNNQAAVDAYKAQQQEIIDASRAKASEIKMSDQQSAKEILEIQRKNNEATAQYVQNYNTIWGEIPVSQREYLAELGIDNARFLQDMVKKWDDGGREQWEQYVAGIEEGKENAAQLAGDAAEEVGDAFVAGTEVKEGELKQAGTGMGDTIGEGAKESTAPSEASQAIADAVIEDLVNADFSGITAAIAAAITSGTADVVSASKSMAEGVLTEVETMRSQTESKVSDMMTSINSEITSKIDTVTSSASTMGDNVVTEATSMQTSVTTIVTNMMTDINSTIITYSETIKSSFSSLGSAVVTEITSMQNRAETITTSMMTSMSSTVSTNAATIQTTVTNMCNKVVMEINSLSTTTQTTITSMCNKVVTEITSMQTRSVSAASTMLTSMNSDFTTYSSSIQTTAKNMANEVVTKIESMQTRSVSATSTMLTDMDSAITSYSSTIGASATALADGVVSSLETMTSGATDAAIDMMDGMIIGFSSKENELYKKVKQIAEEIKEVLMVAWKIKSPSRVMMEIASYAMEGLYVGMDDMEDILIDKAMDIADELTDMLSISPDISASMSDRLRAIVEADLISAPRYDDNTGYHDSTVGPTYVTNLYQTITAPKPLSERELTREAEDFLKRSQFQLP